MRLLLACALVLALATPAIAQPLPASLRSSGRTDAQWSQAQGVIRAQATSLNLREDAVRTLAVEIFEGQPNLSFDACLELIRDGAQRLPQLVATARALDPGGDATLADLQRRAVVAAEAGRLREALTLQDEYRAQYRRALERAVAQPLLNLAAADAAAGDTAYALGDYPGAAARYAEAAETVPASAMEVRWEYRRRQADALYQRAYRFAEPFDESVRLHEQVVLPLAPRPTRPADWATTQTGLGWARVRQGERGDNDALQAASGNFAAAIEAFTAVGDRLAAAEAQRGIGVVFSIQGGRGTPGALERAVAAFEAALAIRTREADPAGWALTQMNLGNTLQIQGVRGAPGGLERAVAAYEAALTVITREADPVGWAMTENNLGNALQIQGVRGAPGALERAVAAYEASLTVITREANPAGWAMAQMNLGNTLQIQGALGAPGALERAVAAFEAARSVRTREADPAGWADTTYGLAFAYRAMARVREARAAAQGALEAYEQVGNAHWASEARAFIARLPAE